MSLEVSRQPAAEPSKLITITGVTQVLRGLLWRHSQKIHFIQRGDNIRPVAAESAMEIDGVITCVSQGCEYLVNMLLGRRNRRGVHNAGNHRNSVSFGFPLFKERHKRKNLQVHDVLHLKRLKKPVVSIASRCRSFINAIIHPSKMFQLGPSSRQFVRQIRVTIYLTNRASSRIIDSWRYHPLSKKQLFTSAIPKNAMNF